MNITTEAGKNLYLLTDFKVLDGPPENSDSPVVSLYKSKEDDDLLWWRSTYITAGLRNGNADGFKDEDLIENIRSATLKPANWKHQSSINVGVIVDAQTIRNEKSGEVVSEIIGVNWRGTPETAFYANKMEELSSQGKVAVSMECLASDVQCSECGETFSRYVTASSDPYGHYCDHLKNRHSNGVTRWIKNPKFIGVGILPIDEEQPADPTAWVKEVAKLGNPTQGGVNMADYTQEQHDAIVKSEVHKVNQELEDKSEMLDKSEAEVTKAKEALEATQAELDGYKSKVDELQASYDELVVKLQDIERSALAEERASILSAIGIESDEELNEKLKSMSEEDFNLLKTVAERKKVVETTDEPVLSFKTGTTNKQQFSALRSVVSREVR